MLIRGIGNPDEAMAKKLLASLGMPSNNHGLQWPLPNLKEVPEKDFWGWRSSWSFKSDCWAGQQRIDGEWATVMIFFVDHAHLAAGGFAVAYFHQYRNEKVRYFEWRACAHEFKERNIGNCLNRYTCGRCGYHYDVDSSG